MTGESGPAGSTGEDVVPSAADLCVLLDRAGIELMPVDGPLSAEADRHSVSWAGRCGLLWTAESGRRLAATRPGSLAAYCYPTAGAQDLFLMADWTSWLFLLDDQNDDGRAGGRPDELDERLVGVAAGLRPDMSDVGTPLGLALNDIAGRVTGRLWPGWRRRFDHHVLDYFRANVCQAAYRRQGQVPDVDIYPALRRDAGAILPSFDLVEFVAGVCLPPALYYSRTYQRLLITAADVVCWTNDVMTVSKELARGDNLNLVLVLREAHGAGLGQAADEVVRRTTSQLERFVAAERELPAVLDELRAGDELRVRVAECVRLLRAWMRGHVEWGRATPRYDDVDRSGERQTYPDDLLGIGPGEGT